MPLCRKKPAHDSSLNAIDLMLDYLRRNLLCPALEPMDGENRETQSALDFPPISHSERQMLSFLLSSNLSHRTRKNKTNSNCSHWTVFKIISFSWKKLIDESFHYLPKISYYLRAYYIQDMC